MPSTSVAPTVSPEIPESSQVPAGPLSPTELPTEVPSVESLPDQPSPAEISPAPVTTEPAVSAPALSPAPVAPPAVPVVPAMEIPQPAEPPIVLPLPAKGPARLGISGAEAAAVGQELTLAVQVSSVERLYSAPLFVNYDPSLLEFVDSKEGTFLGQNGLTTVFSYSPNAAAGQVVIGYKQGVGGPGASGDGSLFTLRFRAKAPGTTRVELNRINFRDPAGNRLPVEPASVGIVIQ